jgi:hypothetical protein
VPPNSGHWENPSSTSFTEESLFTRADTEVCIKPVTGTTFHYWVTPLMLQDKTSGSITVTQNVSGDSQMVGSKVYAYNSDGTFASSSGSYTNSSTIGSVTIPSNGAAVVYTRLARPIDGSGGCARLFKVTW